MTATVTRKASGGRVRNAGGSRGRARVVHPKYGAVVVPHRSNYSALLNAAEYWGCEWTDIRDAEVWAVSHSTAVVMPKEFCGRN